MNFIEARDYLRSQGYKLKSIGKGDWEFSEASAAHIVSLVKKDYLIKLARELKAEKDTSGSLAKELVESQTQKLYADCDRYGFFRAHRELLRDMIGSYGLGAGKLAGKLAIKVLSDLHYNGGNVPKQVKLERVYFKALAVIGYPAEEQAGMVTIPAELFFELQEVCMSKVDE
jgi:hypothetical protein